MIDDRRLMIDDCLPSMTHYCTVYIIFNSSTCVFARRRIQQGAAKTQVAGSSGVLHKSFCEVLMLSVNGSCAFLFVCVNVDHALLANVLRAQPRFALSELLPVFFRFAAGMSVAGASEDGGSVPALLAGASGLKQKDLRARLRAAGVRPVFEATCGQVVLTRGECEKVYKILMMHEKGEVMTRAWADSRRSKRFTCFFRSASALVSLIVVDKQERAHALWSSL